MFEVAPAPQAVAEEIGMKLLVQPYKALLPLSDNESAADAFLVSNGFDPHSNPHIALSVSHTGVLWKRVCVELTVHEVPFSPQKQPGCIYFERYRNGKLVVFGFHDQ